MFSNRVGMQSEKFRPLGNGVSDYGLLGVISLVKWDYRARELNMEQFSSWN